MHPRDPERRPSQQSALGSGESLDLAHLFDEPIRTRQSRQECGCVFVGKSGEVIEEHQVFPTCAGNDLVY